MPSRFTSRFINIFVLLQSRPRSYSIRCNDPTRLPISACAQSVVMPIRTLDKSPAVSRSVGWCVGRRCFFRTIGLSLRRRRRRRTPAMWRQHCSGRYTLSAHCHSSSEAFMSPREPLSHRLLFTLDTSHLIPVSNSPPPFIHPFFRLSCPTVFPSIHTSFGFRWRNGLEEKEGFKKRSRSKVNQREGERAFQC